MATTKKRARKAPKKKATKKRATKAPAKRRAKARPADHISRAHKAVSRVLDHVTRSDVAALDRVKRMVEHALENARRAPHGGA